MYNLLRVVESAVLEKQTTVQYHGKNAIPLPTSNIIWYLAFKNAKKKSFFKEIFKNVEKNVQRHFRTLFWISYSWNNGSTSFLWPWEPVWKWCTNCLKPPHPPTPHREIKKNWNLFKIVLAVKRAGKFTLNVFPARRGFYCISLAVKVNAPGIPYWGGGGLQMTAA